MKTGRFAFLLALGVVAMSGAAFLTPSRLVSAGDAAVEMSVNASAFENYINAFPDFREKDLELTPAKPFDIKVSALGLTEYNAFTSKLGSGNPEYSRRPADNFNAVALLAKSETMITVIVSNQRPFAPFSQTWLVNYDPNGKILDKYQLLGLRKSNTMQGFRTQKGKMLIVDYKILPTRNDGEDDSRVMRMPKLRARNVEETGTRPLTITAAGKILLAE